MSLTMNTPFNIDTIQTPAFVLDEKKLSQNAKILYRFQKETKSHICLAIKAFASYSTFPLISDFFDGISTSSLNETKLAHDFFKKPIHVYSPAYSKNEFLELLPMSRHITFNSIQQADTLLPLNTRTDVSFGIRINPGFSPVKTEIYNPCSPNSRFGVQLNQIDKITHKNITGVHIHSLCESTADDFAHQLNLIAKTCFPILSTVSWINLGGGQAFTSPHFDLEKAKKALLHFKSLFPHLTVYLEPGAALAYDAGYLVTTVCDIVPDTISSVILDTSATAHMPDVLEMPYRPTILNSGKLNEKKHSYRLGGKSCLSGDRIGDYSFDSALSVGDRLIFSDMAQYSIVKTTTFNGIQKPNIYTLNSNNELTLQKKYTYNDYKSQLA